MGFQRQKVERTKPPTALRHFKAGDLVTWKGRVYEVHSKSPQRGAWARELTIIPASRRGSMHIVPADEVEHVTGAPA